MHPLILHADSLRAGAPPVLPPSIVTPAPLRADGSRDGGTAAGDRAGAGR